MHDYAQTYYYARKRGSKKKIAINLFLILILVIGGYSIFNKSNTEKTEAKQVPINKPNPTRQTTPSPPISENKLEQLIKQNVSTSSAKYGIVITNLRTLESYSLNHHEIYKAGSLYKLWIMATIFQQMNENKIKENTILSADIDKLYEKFNLASPSANQKITISVKDALDKMITISDNNTSLLLTSKIRLSNVRNLLKEYTLTESKLGTDNTNPTTTAYDIALIFQKLYDGELIDEESSAAMLEILKNQRLNQKIPKYLPDDIVIAHKTGELDEVTHDTGIVYTPKGDYILVILTKSKPELRSQIEEEIALLSKSVFDYFMSNHR